MTETENETVEPTDDVETTETDTVATSGYTEDEPYVSDTGDKVWTADGKTYRETPDGSLYVVDGDHTDTVVALTALYGL